MPPIVKMLIGLTATVGSAWVFHEPAGYGERLIDGLDAQVRPIVARQELPSVTASFVRSPVSRDLRFSGPANDFQRQRFVEIIQEAQIRGLRSVAWDRASLPVEAPPRGRNAVMLPLFAESLIWQVGGYLLGLSAAYGMFGRTKRSYR